jgi:FkbM family methyltransferase
MCAQHQVEITYEGRRYRLATHGEQDTINRSFKQGRFYEEDLLRAIAALNRPGVYVDVGAHIGNHALFFAAECPSTLVIGFEPWSPSYALAVSTMQANHVADKVHLIEHPVSSRDGAPVTYVPPQGRHNTGMGHTIAGGESLAVSLDGTIRSLAPNEPVALIKIDVEGAEMEVLHGAKATIARWRPIIAIETKTRTGHQQSDEFLTTRFAYAWAGRYCATPTQLYLPKSGENRI